jgi:hypothetical protein
MENATYELRDTQTKKVIAVTTYDKRNNLRRRAEKMNLQYGSHRYSCSPVFANA